LVGLVANPTFQAEASRIATKQNRDSRINCIGWNCRKVGYMIGPIDAIPEQSFPPRNSIRKVGFYVLQHVVWWGCVPTRHFRQTATQLQRGASEPWGQFNCAGQESSA
jgi:hypothetical protein